MSEPLQQSIKDANTLQQLADEVGEEVLTTLLGLFTSETKSFFEQLLVALNDNSQAEITRLLHSIKSGAKTYGANRLAAIAESMEAMAKAGDTNAIELNMDILRVILGETLSHYGAV